MSMAASRGVVIQASFAVADRRGAGRPPSSAQPATAPVRPAAMSALDMMRARSPRPELMPTRPAAVQRAAAAGAHPVARSAAMPLRVQAVQLSSGGQPLPGAVRQRMERLLGTDLSDVRIHQGSQPAAIDAVAFTAGSQIYFAPGHYRPVDPVGQRLLARQLTYVVQHWAGMVRNPLGRGMVLGARPVRG